LFYLAPKRTKTVIPAVGVSTENIHIRGVFTKFIQE